ncbi:MAG: hypothetical protein GW886_13325 [Rhodobacterales bacterium]|nr:hypothetical protein [Rhodobacterales bacterium]NCT11808.1 hypothetical protein [Rhodobacterales bacterium]
MELILFLFFLFFFAADVPTQDSLLAPPDPAQPVPAAEAREPEPQVATGQFTTAVEIRPILDMTQGSWIALREYDGQDLLYFTHLLAWRCGLWEIRYGINGAPATEEIPLEPCQTATATPNAITDAGYPLYLAFPLGSVRTVTVQITYDDGARADARYIREQVLIP